MLMEFYSMQPTTSKNDKVIHVHVRYTNPFFESTLNVLSLPVHVRVEIFSLDLSTHVEMYM